MKKFIDEFYTDILKNGQLPDEDKAFIKDDRYSRFSNILEHRFFKELDYNSVKYLQRAVDAGIAGVTGVSRSRDGARDDTSIDIGKQISSIKGEIETISVGEEGYKEDADLRLHKILKKDIETIEVIKDLLDVVNKIPDNIVRDTLKTIIKADEYSLGRKLNQLREELDRINSKKKQSEGKARILEEEIKTYEDTVQKDIDKYNLEWSNNERKNIEFIGTIDDISTTLKTDFAILKDALEEYAIKIGSLNNAKSIDVEPTRNIEDIVGKIYQKLESIGIYYDDKNSIINSLSGIKLLKKAHIESKKKIPIGDKIIGAIIKTDRIKKQKDAKSDVLLKLTELNTFKVFEAREGPNLSISLIYQYDIEGALTIRKGDIVNGIVKRTQDMFTGADSKLLSDLKIALLSPVQRKTINIGDIVKSNLGYAGDIQRRRYDLKEKYAEIEKMTYDMNRIKSLETILKNNTPIIKRHSIGLKDYYTKITNVEKDVVAMHNVGTDVVRYIMEMQPTNIYKATMTNANISSILVDKDEVASLKQNLQKGLERTIDNRYNVLSRRVIESSDNMKRWDKTKVMNTFVTLSNIGPNDIGSMRTVTNAFSVSSNNYSEWACPSGDIWDVGMVLFIAGVPLDNIRNVTDARAGYARYYEEVSKSEMIFFHHSYMLEKGKFVKRNKIFNIENEDDKMLFLQDDKSVRATFLKNYENVHITECIKDGEDDDTKIVENVSTGKIEGDTIPNGNGDIKTTENNGKNVTENSGVNVTKNSGANIT